MSDSPDDADRSTADAEEFDLERAYDRGELATVFREFADAFAAGRPIRLDGDDRTVEIAVPRGIVAEFEAERDPDAEPPVAELEIELEWDDPDGSSVRIADRDADESAAAGRGGESAAADADPATAVMPPDGVANRDEHAADPSTDADAADAADGAEPSVAVGEPAASPGDEQRASGDGRRSRFEIYEDRAGEWRWRLVHWNGNIVADGGEGYASRSNAERAARSVMRSASTATVRRRD